MSWELFRACEDCGADYGRACRTPEDRVALVPCKGRTTRPGADPTVVRRWMAQRQRRAVLEGLLPGSPAAVTRITDVLEATEAEGKNQSTYTKVGGR
jgi:hypothetical protein